MSHDPQSAGGRSAPGNAGQTGAAAPRQVYSLGLVGNDMYTTLAMLVAAEKLMYEHVEALPRELQEPFEHARRVLDLAVQRTQAHCAALSNIPDQFIAASSDELLAAGGLQ